MARNRFQDPAGNRANYDWQINHSEESAFGKTRNMERAALTGTGAGLVKQQTDSSPLVLKWNGTILHKAQVDEMIAWWELCETQTIYLHDFAGDSYEVIITSFNPTRHRTIRNPRDYANAPLWYWKYELECEVISIIDGPWAGVTP